MKKSSSEVSLNDQKNLQKKQRMESNMSSLSLVKCHSESKSIYNQRSASTDLYQDEKKMISVLGSNLNTDLANETASLLKLKLRLPYITFPKPYLHKLIDSSLRQPAKSTIKTIFQRKSKGKGKNRKMSKECLKPKIHTEFTSSEYIKFDHSEEIDINKIYYNYTWRHV